MVVVRIKLNAVYTFVEHSKVLGNNVNISNWTLLGIV